MGKYRRRRQMLRRLLGIGAGVVALSVLVPDTSPFWAGIGFVAVVVLFLAYEIKRDRQVRALHVAVRRMAAGQQSLSAHASEEGELSLLETELHKLLQVQYELGDRLQRQGKMLADTLADISHQLKTPLTSVSVMTELLENSRLPEDKRAEFVSHIGAETRRMEWLIRVLLQMAQLDAGVIVMQPEEWTVRELLDDVARRLAVSLDLAGVMLTVDADPHLTWRCDKRWTQEALLNIVKNAIEHTPSGRSVSIRAGVDALATWIEVEDEGAGIAKEDLPRVFDRFYRAKDAAPQSFGIGLALAKQILERQEAVVSATNAPRGGAVFTVRAYRLRKETPNVH